MADSVDKEEYKMLLSVALILLCGMGMSWICQKIKTAGASGNASHRYRSGTVCAESSG